MRNKYLVDHFCSVRHMRDYNGLTHINPRAPCLQRLGRFILDLTTASEKNGSTYNYLPSYVQYCEQRRMHSSQYWYVIHPLSLFTKYWQIVMCLVWFTIIPIDFSYLSAYELERCTSSLKVPALENIFTLLNWICMIDFIMRFFTGYIYSKTNEIVLVPTKIIWNYVKTFAFVDVTSFFVFFTSHWSTEKLICYKSALFVVMLVRTVRSVRLSTAFTYLKNITVNLGLTHNQYTYIRFGLLLILMVHFNACLYLFIPHTIEIISERKKNNWIRQLKTIYEMQGREYDTMTLFLHSVMETILRISMISVGTVTPVTLEGAVCCVIAFFCGCCFNIYMIGYIIQHMNESFCDAIQQEKTCNRLKNFCIHHKIPKTLEDSTISHYSLMFSDGNKFYKKRDIESLLSHQLRVDIFKEKIRFISGKYPAIFSDMPAHVWKYFGSLKESRYFVDDIIEDFGSGNFTLFKGG